MYLDSKKVITALAVATMAAWAFAAESV